MSSSIESIADEELALIEGRIRAAAAAPWTSFVDGRDDTSGSSLIRTAVSDIELSGATAADQDFIAHARDDLPRLLSEAGLPRRRTGPR